MILGKYKYLQFLSFDVVLITLVLAKFAVSIEKTFVSYYDFSVLALIVWLIYTIDRLQDVQSYTSLSRGRFTFYYRHKRILRWLAGIVIVLVGVNLFFLSNILYLGGSMLAACCALYLLFQRRIARYAMKEFYIALIFTLGLLMLPYSFNKEVSIFLFSTLFLTVFSNLILLSFFEREEDIRDNFQSLATLFKKETLEKIILVVLSVFYVISLSTAMMYVWGWYFVCIATTYCVVFLCQNWSSKKGRYRLIVDHVLLIAIFWI